MRGDLLLIEFKSRSLEKICTIARETHKKYGQVMAEKIHLRLDQIRAADSIDMLLEHKIGRCHSLKGQRKNQYAMDLEQPHRLIFEIHSSEVQVVRIIEIKDYH